MKFNFNFYDVVLFESDLNVESNYNISYSFNSMESLLEDLKNPWKFIYLLSEMIEGKFNYEVNVDSFKCTITNNENSLSITINSKDYE